MKELTDDLQTKYR